MGYLKGEVKKGMVFKYSHHGVIIRCLKTRITEILGKMGLKLEILSPAAVVKSIQRWYIRN